MSTKQLEQIQIVQKLFAIDRYYVQARLSCYVSTVRSRCQSQSGPGPLSLSCSAPICFIEAVKLLSGVARGQVLSGRQLVPSPLLHQPGEERGGGLVTK